MDGAVELKTPNDVGAPRTDDVQSDSCWSDLMSVSNQLSPSTSQHQLKRGLGSCLCPPRTAARYARGAAA